MNEWNFFVQNGRIQDGCHHQIEWEWKIEVFFLGKRMNPTWQNLSWLPSSGWVRENEWIFFVQMVGTNLVKGEWVWEEILSWLNPTWPNWRCQNSRWLTSSSSVRMNEFESESEWSESVFEWIWKKITRCLNPRWQGLNPTCWKSRWLPSSSWVRINECNVLWKWWEPILANVSEFERKC